jgi:plastocyanin
VILYDKKSTFYYSNLVIAIVASGCSSTTTTTPNPAPAPATTPTPVPQNQQAYTVNIQNNAFNPSSLQITAGSTVKWVNLDPVQHEPKEMFSILDH